MMKLNFLFIFLAFIKNFIKKYRFLFKFQQVMQTVAKLSSVKSDQHSMNVFLEETSFAKITFLEVVTYGQC